MVTALETGTAPGRVLARGFDDVPLSVFDAIDALVRAHARPDFAPLHQGKTTYGPAVPVDAPLDGFELRAHEHAPPAGARSLRERIAAHVGAARGSEVGPERILVCAGATHGIGVVLRAVTEPGDEVLVLSPQWLFASGIVRAARAVAVEVPVFTELSADPTYDFVAALEARVTRRTRAVYFNSPNNPTGFRLSRAQHRALAELADRHGLWLVADNAYENYDFSDEGYLDAATVDDVPRTFAVHTFSKTYGVPGLRVGYVVLPEGTGELVRKLSLHTLYSVATPPQHVALRALDVAPEALAARRARARSARDLVHARLSVPHTRVEGGLYTFLDLRDLDAAAFAERAVVAGVSVAPGEAFGAAYGGWARLCFTAVDESLLPVAIDRLNAAYGASR